MIDEYQPLTPTQVEKRMRWCVHDLEARTIEFERACVAAGEAEADWKRTEARIVVTRESGPVSEAERRALQEHGDQYATYKATAAMRDAAHEKIRCRRAELSALQTIAGSLRDQQIGDR
jgi:hypothetical protein